MCARSRHPHRALTPISCGSRWAARCSNSAWARRPRPTPRPPNWPAALCRAAGAGAPLDVRVIASARAPFDELAAELNAVAAAPGILRIGVFEAELHVTDAAVLAALRAALKAADVRMPIIAGSRAHFTELNR